MAGLVMLALISLMVVTLLVMAVMRKGWKRILQTFLGFLGAIVLLNYYVVKTCGPNKKDVELMKPQAEVITEYILENGVPESMMEIQNLHYVWNSCSKATDGTNVERCFFTINEKDYRAELYLVSSDIYIDIYNKQNETGVYTALEEKKAGSLSIRKQLISYSTKNDGVCNPMRM